MDALEIIRQLESDPGLRAQLRTVLLGDEVLELPAQMRQLTGRVDQLAEGLQQLTGEVHEFVQAAGMRFDRLERQMADVRGELFEQRARELAPSVLSKVGGGLRSVRLVDLAELADHLDEAVDAGLLFTPERDDVLNADLVARAVRGTDRQPVVVVGEALIVADSHDVERAARRAALAKRAFSVDAIPVVVASQVPEHLKTGTVEVARLHFRERAHTGG